MCCDSLDVVFSPDDFWVSIKYKLKSKFDVYSTRVPNPASPGPDAKIHVRQCYHSNERIRFYTYITILDFGLSVFDCTPTSTGRPNARPSLPPSRLPVQADSRPPRPSEAGAVLTARALSALRGGRSLAIIPGTRPIRNICR